MKFRTIVVVIYIVVLAFLIGVHKFSPAGSVWDTALVAGIAATASLFLGMLLNKFDQ